MDLRISVSSLAERLGVASSTLRTWERRYGIGPSEHISGSHRRYTSDDVARLECMQHALADGATPAEAARYAINLTATQASDFAHPMAIDGNVNSVQQIADWLSSSPRNKELADAVRSKDAFALQCMIEDAIANTGVPGTWRALLVPLMSWLSISPEGVGDVAASTRILTRCISSALAVTMIESPIPARRTRVVVTTVPGAAVDLECRALGAALARECIDVALMTSRITAGSIVASIAELQPRALVLWLPHTGTEVAVVPLLRAIRRRSAGLRIFVVGGRSTIERLPRTVDVLDDMESAVDAVVGALT